LAVTESGVDLRFNSVSNGTGLASASNANIVTLSADWAQIASTTNAVGVSNFVVGVSNRLNSFSVALTNRADTNYILVNNASNFLVAVSNRVDLFTTALTNHGSAVLQSATNYTIAATNSASVTNWINFRMVASANLTNWSLIPTGSMANVVAVDWLTNWSGAISNLAMTKQHGTTNLTNFSATATVDGNGNTTIGGSLELTNNSETALLVLRSSNSVGAIGFTLPGPWRATNVLSLSLTNIQAGDGLFVSGVSGNVATLTNGPPGGASSSSSPSFDATVGYGFDSL